MNTVLEWLAEFVKAYLLPGSSSLLLILSTALVAWWLIDTRRRQQLRTAMVILLGSYWVMALPAVPSLFERALTVPADPNAAQPVARAIVVLGGGQKVTRLGDHYLAELSSASAERALEGARLYAQWEPAWLIVSGGSGADSRIPESLAIKAAMVELGVPEDEILLESDSSDTHQQALLLAPVLANLGIEEFYLVTSATHMRRAWLAFRAAGLDPIPSPAEADSPNGSADSPLWLPSLDALNRTTVVARELLALAYYWMRGWI